ncbi:hypothetical protein G7092_19995 [Mucilaginibacter sp. HC2]|uniref:hypothetical protein n=1 Tax=Mucilaginibacter inviolabilis TaxID=2714892 RepID=UPI00140CC405|nr:hypothetical protein [Mucilaginibacter inviolabilis]NHA06102.1 hypothetical protein [Mucilaginibacter inviolabilis]
MKKLILSLSLFLSFSSLVHAQWTTNGANTITSTSNFVGIGTTTPVSPLQVQVSNLGLNITGGFRNSNNGAGNGTTTAGTAVGIGFLNELNGNWWKAAIVHERTNAYGVGNLHFLVNNSIDNSTVTLNDAKMTIQSSGNVGIGTTTPNTKLDVNGVISVNGYGYMSCLRTSANNFTNLFLGGAIKDNADGTYTAYGDGGSNYFSAIKMDNGGDNGGGINFYNGASTGGTSYTVPGANLPNYLQMRIAGGNVSIGTSDSRGYKLAVNGSVIATSVTVKLKSDWPDYVFKKDYQLPSLQEVKAYIDQNQHLPEMPSEQEVAKDGLNLGEMNKLLVKKVEELTLYLIEKDHKEKEQGEINKIQETRLKTQQDQIDQLKKTVEQLINTIK